MTADTSSFLDISTVHLSADRLRDLRKKKGYSVAQMASVLGVAPATLEAWESGRRSVVADTIRISSLYKIGDPPEQPNRILGQFALKEVRQIVGLSVIEFARRYGYSEESWRSFEQGRRVLPDNIVRDIESKLGSALAGIAKMREILGK